MEKTAQEIAEQNPEKTLWLTDRLVHQLVQSSKIGRILLVILMLLGLSSAAQTAYFHYWLWSAMPDPDFYLLEPETLTKVLSLLYSIGILYFFARAAMEGFFSWRLLRHCDTDDEALLEGTERLGKMFRWLSICGITFLAVNLLELSQSAFNDLG